MEAIKLRRTIRSSSLHIHDLEQFQGQTVEIIILALEQKPRAKHAITQKRKKTAGGMLSKYKNVELWEQESRAWELAVKEKYADR